VGRLVLVHTAVRKQSVDPGSRETGASRQGIHEPGDAGLEDQRDMMQMGVFSGATGRP